MQRFWDKVKIGKPDECWEWQAGHFGTGYGAFKKDGHIQYAHRIAWVLSGNKIPKDFCICHHCDNKNCCNPKHLFLGTKADNNKDRAAKGRSVGNRKITEQQVLEVRKVSSGKTQTVIAEQYGIKQSTVSAIQTKQNWKWLK